MSRPFRLRPVGFIDPCQPSTASKPPSGRGWLHESQGVLRRATAKCLILLRWKGGRAVYGSGLEKRAALLDLVRLSANASGFTAKIAKPPGGLLHQVAPCPVPVGSKIRSKISAHHHNRSSIRAHAPHDSSTNGSAILSAPTRRDDGPGLVTTHLLHGAS
jgi:hypothetical protein